LAFTLIHHHNPCFGTFFVETERNFQNLTVRFFGRPENDMAAIVAADHATQPGGYIACSRPLLAKEGDILNAADATLTFAARLPTRRRFSVHPPHTPPQNSPVGGTLGASRPPPRRQMA
jgi:hypothetical protein